MPKTRYHYNIMLRPEPEGGYTALVPALPAASHMVVGLTKPAKWLETPYLAISQSLRKAQRPIPTDDGTLVASLDFEYSR